MNFLRALLASLLSLVCTITVSAFVTLQTLETTALDRTEVKGWLDKSGVYNNLLATVLNTNTAAQQDLDTGSSIVTSDDVKSALAQTMNPGYAKQSTEKVVDSAYNWLDGKSSTIAFEINTTEKKDEFTANLSTILQPQLAQLPQCLSLAQFQTNNPPCLPAGTTAKQAADELATDAANEASIFREPITNKTIAQSTGGSAQTDSPLTHTNSSAEKIRDAVGNLRMWLIWLPIIGVVSGGLMVSLSQHKLKATKHLTGRLTVGLVLTCAAGLLVANVGKVYSFKDLTSTDNVIMAQVIEPFIHQAAPAIGFRLALVSGLLGFATFIVWITLLIIKRKHDHAELLATPEKPTIPSQTEAPNAPQPQSAPTNPPKDEQK
jgi:hypothetical protein